MNPRIESLLSARLFLAPQLVGDSIYFLSNLSGHLSLYSMNYGGSVPEPLLPSTLALQNPELIDGFSYRVFPNFGKILVMIDNNGDENYQPMFIPLDGGFPEPAFDNFFANHRVHLTLCDIERDMVYFSAERRDKPISEAYRADLAKNKLTKLAESKWGAFPSAYNNDHTKLLLVDGYTVGDVVIYLLEGIKKSILYGKPLYKRKSGEIVPLNGLGSTVFTKSGRGVLVTTSVFEDTFSVGYFPLDQPGTMKPVSVKGLEHSGLGELTRLEHLYGEHYALTYNIDGSSLVYEGKFDEDLLSIKVKHLVVGDLPLDAGELEHLDYNKAADVFTLSFSTAVSPTQIYSIEKKKRDFIIQHTNEKVLGIPEQHLSRGEDASYTSFDGLRISARLYLPSNALGNEGPRPLVYYIHGGPQGQERPNFAWFSMPLIQFLTLRGFAVFVPNVRGSTGYGLSYTKRVDRDWGGQDRLDHVHAMTEVLPKDKRLDVTRAAVVGRSYGGYMTLNCLLNAPDTFRAGIAGAPVVDWKFYDSIYTERYMDLPEANQEGYGVSSLLPNAGNLKAALLLVHNLWDDNVHFQNTLQLMDRLQRAGKQFQLMIYPQKTHGVRGDAVKHMQKMMLDFFLRELRPEPGNTHPTRR